MRYQMKKANSKSLKVSTPLAWVWRKNKMKDYFYLNYFFMVE